MSNVFGDIESGLNAEVSELRRVLRAVVERWRTDYHCCEGSRRNHVNPGTGKSEPHSPDCPLEEAARVLVGRPR